MPANLTPEFLEARERFRKAKTDEERLEALMEMLATIPKHKGTEKMVADIKRRIAKLKEKQEQRRRSGGRSGPSYHVEREGAAQMVLVGPPNTGKSSLLALLTNANPEIAPYPMSTFRPCPGMMEYEDIQIQLVDLPPITREYTEGWVFSLIRTADGAIFCVDLSLDDWKGAAEEALEILRGRHIVLGKGPTRQLDWRTVELRALALGTKVDLAPDKADEFREWAAEKFFASGLVSLETFQGVEETRELIFRSAGIVRVYTKKPGHPPDMEQPYTLREGSTILDVVEHIHKEFVERLKYVRLWGSGKFDGQHAPLDHVVQDGDIVEIHIS